MRKPFLGRAWVAVALAGLVATSAPADEPGALGGTLPTDAKGAPLNFDFETGTLKDWTPEGDAFAGMPVEGDTVAARRSDMKSRHAGRFWVGSYERHGDDTRGTLTSVPFVVMKPYASFLVGGGNFPTTAVELIRKDTGKVVRRVSGESVEDMSRVVVDLTPHLGKELVIRLVDDQRGGWGHLNFDDFRLHDAKPSIPDRPDKTPGEFAHSGLPPSEAAAAMTVPPGFKVTLFAGEPDVHQPIAFAIDDRGRLWVAEAYSYPIRRPAGQGRDRILIFEDEDNDGHFDSQKVFADRLNLVSGIEVGFGGVWVGAAPEFLFIPDKDGDDRPDGPPQVVLDGWGLEDTHETLNSFIWGPDGWLYGCHGVFTHSKVGKPGSLAKDRIPLNAGIWRYHPTKDRFEVFAHGTSNPWGFDFDANGQGFLTSCVIPHLYHIIPGARYERQGGQHFETYTYDDIKTIADHRHYVGNIRDHAWWGHAPLPANATLAAGGGHAHAGAMIYQGDAWPAEYRGSIYMNNIHGARINRDILKPQGSGFVGSHAPDLLVTNDSWSQIISLKSGPDGNVYMIDWYDGQQCHVNDPDRPDRSNGRIFKVSYGERKRRPAPLGAMNDRELVRLLASPNVWHSRTARRLLQERSGGGNVSGEAVLARIELAEMAMKGATAQDRLRALWALHSIGGSIFSLLESPFASGTPAEVGWRLRLAFEDKSPSPALLAAVRELARSTSSPVVRLEIASALQRTPLDDRWPILEALLVREEDAADRNIPFLIWYAAEPLAERDASRLLAIALAAKIPMVRDFAIRRVGAIGTPAAIAGLVDAIAKAEEGRTRLALLQGLNESLRSRRQVAMPPRWPDVFASLVKDSNTETRSQATALALTFGDASARTTLRQVVADAKGDIGLRKEALAALLKAKDPELGPILRGLVGDPALRGAALRGLAGYDDDRTVTFLIGSYAGFSPEERRDALNTLAARPMFARALLAAVEGGRIARTDLSADIVRQLRNLNDSYVNDKIAKVWGSARPTSSDRARQIAEFKQKLALRSTPAPDVALGRAVFAKTCAQCHALFGEGGKVGPDLTGSNRRDLQYVLENILDPSALIGKDYLAHIVATSDGRTLTGIIRGEDRDAITLVTANETLTIPKTDVEGRRPSEASMMPDDLLRPLSDVETRSLIAYLASPGQTPILATPENASSFFNGRDLTGWDGDPRLWSVEGGEIVGKTAGLKRNEFLRSTMLAGDFRLSLDVKLVDNAGNSGIQFRSEPLPDGEMKGDQADVGPGWWGKLYEENGRGLLWDKSGEAHVKLGDWNHYEVVAVGSKVTTAINGQSCVDLDDPKGARRGIFALQLHSGGATEVRFRNVRLEVVSGAPPATR